MNERTINMKLIVDFDPINGNVYTLSAEFVAFEIQP